MPMPCINRPCSRRGVSYSSHMANGEYMASNPHIRRIYVAFGRICVAKLSHGKHSLTCNCGLAIGVVYSSDNGAAIEECGACRSCRPGGRRVDRCRIPLLQSERCRWSSSSKIGGQPAHPHIALKRFPRSMEVLLSRKPGFFLMST